jgi:hypothetical protein
MLFNLSQQRHFPHSSQAKWAIGCRSVTGPGFCGDNDWELCAWDEPFNGDNNCFSWANKNGYLIPLKDGKNMLTDKSDGYFTITELEVWEVKYIVNYNKSILI